MQPLLEQRLRHHGGRSGCSTNHGAKLRINLKTAKEKEKKNIFYLVNMSGANLTTMQLLNVLKEVDNGFQYTIPSSVEYKGIDKAFDSSKRKI